MMPTSISIYRATLKLLIMLMVFSCTNLGENDENTDVVEDACLKRIMSTNKIRAVTNYSSTNYFIYRGRPMGYNYEMMLSLAEYLGVKLEIKVIGDLNTAFKMLESGECDIIARGITYTKERAALYSFTNPILLTKQVLVQRIPSQTDTSYTFINNVLDLAHKTVHIPRSSSFKERLQNLSNEIGDTIFIEEVADMGTEELIGMVASGEIDYTVCDDVVGLINKTYFQNIDVSIEVSFSQKNAWVTRTDCPEFLDTINIWLNEFLDSRESKQLYAKYFQNRRAAGMVQSSYYSVKDGRISIYDELLKKKAKKIGWDWRLLASLIYQESQFIEDTVSWAGAYGIMQLMPATAERFGVNRESPAVDNIAAGIKFIKWLDKILPEEIADPKERIKFILASYNSGPGHVLDARRLAKKYGYEPNIWNDNVSICLLKKSNPKYYNDPVVKSGYCRGVETVKFVEEILRRYEDYRNLVKN